MECSNKGTCNRDDGTCTCFPGYEGTACQRASCPNACSGHGTCETIKELAEDKEEGDLSKGAYAMNGFASDHAGIGDLSGVGYITYELWDKTLTMGCKCDPGYTGPDCSLRLCRYGVDPLFIPSNYQYSADGIQEYDWDAPHFEKSYVEILGYQGMKGQFDLVIYDVYGEKYSLDAINYQSYASGNYTTCEEIMSYFPNWNLRDTIGGTYHHQMSFKGGLVSSAYVGSITKPFCTAMDVNQTEARRQRGVGGQKDLKTLDGLSKDAYAHYYELKAANHHGHTKGVKALPVDVTEGIRYEFDYNRGNPGYIKDLYIKNLIPEQRYASIDQTTTTAGVSDILGEISVFGYYGVDKQGEVAEYHDINKNWDPKLNRFMYADVHTDPNRDYDLAHNEFTYSTTNKFSDGHHEWQTDFGVTLPGFIISAKNGSTEVLLSKDVHFYIESAYLGGPDVREAHPFYTDNTEVGGEWGKAYKTAKIMIFGREYLVNSTRQQWLEVEGPSPSEYLIGPDEDYNVHSKIFRPITNLTLTSELIFPDYLLDYTNITYKYIHTGSNQVLQAIPEKVTVKAKLMQRYQYVSECSGRGNCDRTSGLCQCFAGYSNDNCDTQTPVC